MELNKGKNMTNSTRFLLAALATTTMLASSESHAIRHVVQTIPVTHPQTGDTTPVIFKLDTIDGNIWKQDDRAFVPISVEEAWTLRIHDNQAAFREKQHRIAALTKRMDQIMIPELNVRQADIRDVLSLLQEMSVTHSPDQTGFSMALFLTLPKRFYSADFHFLTQPSNEKPKQDFDLTKEDPPPPLITFSARELTLRQALDAITDQAGLQWRFANGLIKIKPQGFFGDGSFFSRMYDLTPSAIKRLNHYHPELWEADLSEQERSAGWQAFFARHGVTWPIGSSIQPLPLQGKLSVKNDTTNLQRINQILADINTYPPTPGRFQLIPNQGQDQNILILLDAALGHTWKYTIKSNDDTNRQEPFFQYLNHHRN